MNKEKIQWIAWETVKTFIVIACTAILCANFLMAYYTIETNRSLDVIYSDIQDYNKEIIENLDTLKHGRTKKSKDIP
jgi:hypothetical protein